MLGSWQPRYIRTFEVVPVTLFEQALDSLVRLQAASLHTHLEVVSVTLFEQALDSLVKLQAALLHTRLAVVPVTDFIGRWL